MRARPVKPLEWNSTGGGEANGLRYEIFSEHVRGEPRFYWPMVGNAGNWKRLYDTLALHVTVEEPDGYRGTLAQAKRYAALHAEAVAAAIARGEPTP